MNLHDITQRCCDHKQIVCLVGGGGKTTTMFHLASECAGRGKKVLVTTTTHIFKPDDHYAMTDAEARALWAAGTYAVIGTPVADSKLSMPAPELYESLAEDADLVLIEADGSKRLPAKIPNSTEPVIPADCNLVLGVMGMSALGRELRECCFRFDDPETRAWLGLPEDAVMDEETAARILASERGTRQYASACEYIVLLNQCDSPEVLARAEVIQALLAAEGITAIPTSHEVSIPGLIVVRGGGDVATGTIHALWSHGYPVMVLEAEKPAAVRRRVSVCEAVYDGSATVEGMTAVLISCPEHAAGVIEAGRVPVLVDREAKCLARMKPAVLIDATLAKHVITTTIDMAPLTIGLGPGFVAGENADYVVETMRGDDLGKIIAEGPTMRNTGVPGNVGGYTLQRVLRAPEAGAFRSVKKLGDPVQAGEIIGYIIDEEGAKHPIRPEISGFLRGWLRDWHQVIKGFKVGDVDPRMSELDNLDRITDKSNRIGESVLTIVQNY